MLPDLPTNVFSSSSILNIFTEIRKIANQLAQDLDKIYRVEQSDQVKRAIKNDRAIIDDLNAKLIEYETLLRDMDIEVPVLEEP